MKQFYEKKEKKIKNKQFLKKLNIENKLMVNLFKSNNHVGYPLKESNPKSFKYLHGIRSKQCIINLEHTVESLKRSFLLINYLLSNKKTILIICNDFKIDFMKKEILKSIINTPLEKQIIIIPDKWINGYFTNFYNKKKISLIISFVNNSDILIKESTISNIPLMSFTDTNKNPDNITYPILSNNSSIKSLFFLITLFTNF